MILLHFWITIQPFMPPKLAKFWHFSMTFWVLGTFSASKTFIFALRHKNLAHYTRLRFLIGPETNIYAKLAVAKAGYMTARIIWLKRGLEREKCRSVVTKSHREWFFVVTEWISRPSRSFGQCQITLEPFR